MIRSALAVVPDSGKYVCALVSEQGQIDLKILSDWKTILEDIQKDAKKKAAFRALLVPQGFVVEGRDDLPYFVWDQTWSATDQDFWMEFIRKALKEDRIKLPPMLESDLNLITRVISGGAATAKTKAAKKSPRWSKLPLNHEPKLVKLYATLQAFKAVGVLQKTPPKHVKSSYHYVTPAA